MKTIALLLLFFLIGCKNDPSKKFTMDETLLVDVSAEIIDLDTEQLLSSPILTTSGRFLIITDMKSNDQKGIHIYDKRSLQYLASTGIQGEGPGEITRYGEIGVTPKENEFWVPDLAKVKIFKFNMDSVFLDKNYLPGISKPFSYDFFLSRFKFISEDRAIGTGVEVLTPNTFRTSLGSWNLTSGEVIKIGYEHPKLKNERTNAYYDYSFQHNIMALSYVNHDIITVFDNQGDIKFNILGPNEFDNQNRKLEFFGQIHIGNQYIFTRYLGDKGVVLDDNLTHKSVQASKFLMFDLEGNLFKILETGHEIRYFAVDEEGKRIFSYFMDRENPIGYFYYE